LRKLYAILLLALLVAGVSTVVGIATFSGSVTWTAGSKDFEVYDSDPNGILAPQPLGTSWSLILGTVDLSEPLTPPTFNFYVKNTGDIPTTYEITEQLGGCTSSWSTTQFTLAPDEIQHLTLQLTITEEGFYNFEIHYL
jgi:hypothetical protein